MKNYLSKKGGRCLKSWKEDGIHDQITLQSFSRIQIAGLGQSRSFRICLIHPEPVQFPLLIAVFPQGVGGVFIKYQGPGPEHVQKADRHVG